MFISCKSLSLTIFCLYTCDKETKGKKNQKILEVTKTSTHHCHFLQKEWNENVKETALVRCLYVTDALTAKDIKQNGPRHQARACFRRLKLMLMTSTKNHSHKRDTRLHHFEIYTFSNSWKSNTRMKRGNILFNGLKRDIWVKYIFTDTHILFKWVWKWKLV